MSLRVFSHKNRPFHLGPYLLECLRRQSQLPDLSIVPQTTPLLYDQPEDPESLVNAMSRFSAMFDAIRDGPLNTMAEIPEDLVERSQHLKATGYFFDATQMGICKIPHSASLQERITNPSISDLVSELQKNQPKTYASGVDAIYADVLNSAEKELGLSDFKDRNHSTAMVFLIEYPRDPRDDEPGTKWFQNAQAHRAALLSSYSAGMVAQYLRLLGYDALAHSASASDVCLNQLAVASGLVRLENDQLVNPYLGTRYGIAAVTTTCKLEPDQPLAEDGSLHTLSSHGPAWWTGKGTQKNAFNHVRYRNREFRMGEYPFEKLKRVDKPTTFIDEERVPRFPKRADFFARSGFGDLGKLPQDKIKDGIFVLKHPLSACARRGLGAFMLLQHGDARGPVSDEVRDPKDNSDNLKGISYFLSTDAVGLSRCPDWSYYSHDAHGNEINPYHKNAISLLLDQGYETADGSSGDDWISSAQSMRAYLRFSLIGGVVGEQIRRVGYSARVHSAVDGELLQPGLLLLSGLGEVSRIGEVILNPYLGPRLKSGVISTNMPMKHDKPIDFGLQTFCNNCNKCARECPSGAITLGPKLMYNGYEIWKSDAEKCTRYRLTNMGGALCGRCMKTCPWNLEGLFADASFRWLAMNFPSRAKQLAALDDKLGRGSNNPVKKWWWDLEIDPETGKYNWAEEVSDRDLSPELDLKYEDQTLAVYPADVMPPPYPANYPVNREEGIARYKAMLTPKQYLKRLSTGDTLDLVPQFKMPEGPPPYIPVVVSDVKIMPGFVTRYEFTNLDRSPLPAFEAGAHVDIIIAPEYPRQYSMAGDPADRSKYTFGILKEDSGRGGSKLLHKVFNVGRKVFISPPINHFPLDEKAEYSFLFAGGIGVTPMISMAHRLHKLNREFSLHYSVKSRDCAGFLDELAGMPWVDRVHLHFDEEDSTFDLESLLTNYQPGYKLYTCGPEGYMDWIFSTASKCGWLEEDMRREYFSVPDVGDWDNHEFQFKLTKSGTMLTVGEEENPLDVLLKAGHHIPAKCTEGLCGVCAVPFAGDEVEHRDFVLSAKEREEKIILCCSRAKDPGGVIEVPL